MASAERVEVMKAPKAKILKVLTDYESYSDFMEGVSKVQVLERDGDSVKCQYDLNVIKKFSYILDLKESDEGVSWSFNSGDIFSQNEGSWKLKELSADETEVTYNVEVEIKVKMMGSGMIIKKLVNTTLPSMMKAVEKRAQNI